VVEASIKLMRKWREPHRQQPQKAGRNLVLPANSDLNVFLAMPIRGLGISKVSFSFLLVTDQAIALRRMGCGRILPQA
jgi:hypothetical protein